MIDAHAAAQPDAPFLLAPEPDATLTYGGLARTAQRARRVSRERGRRSRDRSSRSCCPTASARRASSSARCTAATSFRRSTCSRRMRSSTTRWRIRERGSSSPRRNSSSASQAIVRGPRAAARLRPTDPDRLELPGRRDRARRAADRSADAGDADVHVGHDRRARRACCSRTRTWCTPGARSRERMALTPGDRVLSSLPLYHINGQCIATVAPLVSGGSIVMPHRFSVSQWWPLVERYRPTWLNVVPTIIAYLLDRPRAHAGAVGGVPRRALRAARRPRRCRPSSIARSRSASASRCIEAMGLTECASIAFANPLDPRERRSRHAGRPLGVEARVVAPDGTRARRRASRARSSCAART